MPRPQYNRMQERVYRYLRKQDEPKTAHEIVWWYMEEYAGGTKGRDGYYTRSGMANSPPTPNALSNVMRRSLLFECVGKEKKNGKTVDYDRTDTNNINLWVARPLDVVVERAIASKRPIEKYPAFLRKEIRRVLDAEDN